MNERDRPDPYWQHDFPVDLGRLAEPPGFGVRFKAHQAPEQFHRGEGDELVPLRTKRGTRLYFHGKPYRLEPDYHLTVALHPLPPPTGEIGVVDESRWEGLRHREIGQAQGWYFPEDRTLILWECFLEQHHRRGYPQDDDVHGAVWQAWEEWLVDRSPCVERIVSTWEDLYGRSDWHAFLDRRGYRSVAPAAFIKEVRAHAG